MSDIEVEAVDSIDTEEITMDESAVPAGVDAPEYVLYGGKGGVGKTTCAAATALASANEGTATLVVSTDPAHSLSDILGVPVPNEPTRMSENHPLYGVEIDPEETESAFEQGLGSMDDLFGDLDGQMGDASESEMGIDMEMGPFDPSTMPGADESAALQLLLEYLDDPRFDRVVIDTAPTGHTLRLLSLPELMDSMMGRLLSFRERLQGVLGNMPGPFGDSGTGMDQLEEIRDRIERLRAALCDPAHTEFRVVMVPERLSVIESERLLRHLDEFGIPTGTVVVNRVTEDLEQVTDIDADGFVTPNPEECEFCRQRWESQQDALQRAQELFRGREIKRIPLFASEIHGPEMLQVVAACLD